ncbi:MAG: AGE family epimerase/isomerase [Mucilaginibacter sp.]|uniref:AGE family epimerase/isomerase n=1 Tax=Mucilaginibacter sp. TaxID=1882438 RepID=UPI003564A5DF
MINNAIMFSEYAKIYRDNLLNDVIPFWLNNSADDELGGYFTCLDTKGEVFDTDKFVWLQGRQVWTFAMLYNNVEQKQEWLDFALHGAVFLLKHGRDTNGNWYFSLNRSGVPLTQPYNIFSDCFAAMAFAQLYKATQNELYKTVAIDTFNNILKKKDDPKGVYNKAFPGTRPLQGFSLPMILCNLVLEMEFLLDAKIVDKTINEGIEKVMDVFYQPDLGLILESVTPNGDFSDSFDGRLVNPGHSLEAMWFIMDLANRKKDSQLMKKAVDIAIDTLVYGWDEEFGGIFYFKDVKGHPPLQLEWDQKLWWVHIETLITLIKGYYHTNDERCLAWFKKVHDYTFAHFPDAENGEWFGYLNRQGQVLMQLKGGKWKGCFHIPRGLLQCSNVLQSLAEMQENPKLINA